MFGDVLNDKPEDEEDEKERSIEMSKIGNQDSSMIVFRNWVGRTGMLKNKPKRNIHSFRIAGGILREKKESVPIIRMMKSSNGIRIVRKK